MLACMHAWHAFMHAIHMLEHVGHVHMFTLHALNPGT